jgi:hypothetical protein
MNGAGTYSSGEAAVDRGHWLSVLKASFGSKLTVDELVTFKSVAGDRDPPGRQVRELWAIIGRRGGKSRIAAAIASYIAVCIDHKGKLAAGEQGVGLVLAASMSQAAVVLKCITYSSKAIGW